MNDTVIKAILKINPNAEFTINADDINQITWLNETTPISKADIEAQFPAVEFDMAMKDLRVKRNRLLADTDHLALSDNTLSSDMTTYRQELRDLPSTVADDDEASDVDAVTFPTKP